jgi:uncharacterized cysteine cluster protein YcgN (CxxCxxCC family)
MPSRPDPAHEALCRRCARCCYEKLIVDGRVFTTRAPCPYLDVQTRLCTVYERRLQVNPRCLDVKQGIELGVFPASCPYVRGLRGYRPSEAGWLEAEIVRKIEQGLLLTGEDVVREMRRSKRRR